LLSLSPQLVFDEIANYRALWASRPEAGLSQASSITDEPNFLSAVAEALRDSSAASRFRSNVAIIATYDHVSRTQGLACLLAIVGRGGQERLKDLADVSDFGRPIKFHYPELGRFSPTVLRLAKTALDLEFFFPDLSKHQITEIGVGFGGQAIALNRFFGARRFVFYDLPEVNQLASRTLDFFTRGVDLVLHDGRRPVPIESELLVSNFAFSELEPKLQAAYLEKVVLRAKRGFMHYNTLSERSLGGYSVKEISDMLPGSVLLPEEPATNPGNVTLVWGSPKFNEALKEQDGV